MPKNDVHDLFFSYTRDFLFLRLRQQNMMSGHTIKAYRQGLKNFRMFMLEQHGMGVDKVTFEMVTADLVRDYLKNITDKGLSLATRNLRITCLKQYMAYCSERNVELSQYYIPVSKIKHVTVHAKKDVWMTREAVQTILLQPPKTKLGVRDRFHMIFLYGTGARISEALNVKLKDIETLTEEPFVRLLGKGDKPRCVPLLDVAMENLEYYLSLYHPNKNPDDYLFYTIIKGHKDKMSVANAERFIKKYGRKARLSCSQIPESVYPHLFRHSYGAHLYRMGFSLAVIANLLGHESLDTAERYADTDYEMIKKAFKTIDETNPTLPQKKAWREIDEETLAVLYGLAD